MTDVTVHLNSLSMKENNEPPVAPDLAALLDELNHQFQIRLDALRDDLQDGKNQQQQAYASGMLKLPKSLRSMRVSEFNALYKMDLLQAARRIREGVGKKRDREQPIVAETPNPTRPHKKLETPSRTARRGEILL